MTNKEAHGPPASRRLQTPKGYYNRGYLPHLDNPRLVQMVTYRLADSMPAQLLDRWRQELELPGSDARDPATDKPEQQHRRRRYLERIENYLDQGHGECLLRNPQIASLVEQSLLHFHGSRYWLFSWVIMPNHVHLVVRTADSVPLHKVVQGWKSFTAKQANDVLRRGGRFWQRDYHDRFIRDDAHLERAMNYVHGNPVKAGLVGDAVEWVYSSARRWADGEWRMAL